MLQCSIPNRPGCSGEDRRTDEHPNPSHLRPRGRPRRPPLSAASHVVACAILALAALLGSPAAQAGEAAPAARGPGVHVGIASYYSARLAGRPMSDGTPMRPDSDNAASRVLPLGSRAVVTNLRNGRSAVVTIRDRGPFVRGRVIDVSPATARQLGLLHAGLARVEVVPLGLAPAIAAGSRAAAGPRVAADDSLSEGRSATDGGSVER